MFKAGSVHAELRIGIGLDLNHRHALIPVALIGRRQAHAGKLGGDIKGCNFMALGAGIAAFEQVIGKEGHMRLHRIRRDAVPGRGG